MSELNLVLNAPRARVTGGPGPSVPTLIPPGYAKPLTFTDVDALARHLHRRRGRRGLQLTRTVAHYGGSDTFSAFVVRWVDDAGDDEYAYTAIQGRSLEALQAALATTNPDTPKAP